ncbi:MAG: sensor domain-containing diguanylate cyclase [Desulfovibrionaceae bacterium]|nr:sensor domain-containing diguanylate cyclase [Desulfovibrionaceae bacterium]
MVKTINNNTITRNIQSIIWYIVLSITILCLNIFVAFTYKNIVIEKERDYTYQTLNIFSKNQSDLLQFKIESQYLTLELFANLIAYDDNPLQSAINKENILIKKTDFLHIFTVDTSGKAISESGAVVNVSDRKYFHESLAGKRSAQYIDSGYISGTVRLILSVPIIKNGEVVGVLYCSYDEEKFRALFESDGYKSKSYSFVIDKQGNSLVQAKSPEYLLGNNNVIEYLKEMGNDITTLQSDLQNGNFGIIRYTIGTEKRYATYGVIGNTDWVLFNAVSDTVIESKSKEIVDIAQFIFLFISIISIIFFGIIIFIAWRNNKTQLYEQEQEKVNFERTRIAIENSSVFLWDYDLNTNTITQTPSSMKWFGSSPNIENFPEVFIEQGNFEQNEIQKVREFYKSLSSGIEKAEEIICFKTCNDTWIYSHITYTIIFDSNDKPFKAIGIGSDVTSEYISKQHYERELALQKIMTKNTIRLALLNVTKRTIEYIQYNSEYTADTIQDYENTYDEFLKSLIDKIIDNDELKIFIADIREGNINKYLTSENTILEFEAYRYNRLRKESQFVHMSCSFLYEPTSHDLMAFLCTKDMSKEKENLELLTLAAEKDSMTHIYNHNTSFARIESYLLHEGAEGTHALFIIDLDDFKNINDTLGHPIGDAVLINTAEHLCSLFRSDDIIGRIGGDEFIVLMKNITSNDVVSKAKQLNRILKIQEVDSKKITSSVSIGIYIFCNSYNISQLYENADNALYQAKKQGKNTYHIYYDPAL